MGWGHPLKRNPAQRGLGMGKGRARKKGEIVEAMVPAGNPDKK